MPLVHPLPLEPFVAGSVDVAEAVFAPRQRLAPHEHEESRICVVLSGSFHEVVGRRSVLVGPGWSYHLPAGASHGNEFSPDGARCLRVRFPLAVQRELTGTDRPAPPWLRAGDPRGWEAMLLLRDLRNAVLTPLAVEAFLSECLAADRVAPGRPFPGAAPRWLVRIREALDASSARPPRLGQLALLDGVHPMSISRAFRQWFGCSVGEYVQARRVAAACHALLRTDESLASIALDLGYQDQPHFTRHFRSRIGVSPGRYRGLLGGRHERAGAPGGTRPTPRREGC